MAACSKDLGNFLNSEAGAGLLGGIGEAIGEERRNELLAEREQAERDWLRERDERITESYSVPAEALGGTYVDPDRASRPTPSTKWAYNPNSGMIERGA